MRTLTSERLVLRPWEPADADFLLDLEGRWEVVRHLGAAPTPMTSHDEALASVHRRRAISAHHVHGVWLVTDHEGRRLGNLLLKPVPLSAGEPPTDPPEVEVGWHLHPGAWGHGHATEAARLVLDDAFARGLPRAVAVVHPDNLASLAVCRRLGMRHLGPSTRYMGTTLEVFELVAP
ncbi:GNAT family N-acetyltransferase [Arthrobacter sp. NEB 688]|uniref:GNAT family N-acetyltransferase n=1 Tax=Arthrobacter sp. NEB 688 TaxID=904039 RepID=UPI001562F083|nr:GNAT family N-acetyltransferase [Arthrobacter sp. NEB 688]QKE83076.1 GNAT family N-acetyltransferase [Arthrobacter sp. NEB 688]